MVIPIALQKAWKWLKHYWWIPLAVIVGVVLLIVWRPGGRKLLEMVSRQQERHREEIRELELIHEEEKRKLDEAQEQYEDRIEIIREEHRAKIEELDAAEKERAEELLEQWEDDPEGVSRQLADLLGADYIPPGGEK